MWSKKEHFFEADFFSIAAPTPSGALTHTLLPCRYAAATTLSEEPHVAESPGLCPYAVDQVRMSDDV